MTPTPPSPEDDLLDLTGLGTDTKSKSKASQQESDFEKELEALFAEDLAEAAESGSTLTTAKTQAAKDDEADDDPLLLSDLLDDDEPVASAAPAPTAADEDVLDLGDFAAEPVAEPLAGGATSKTNISADDDDDDILDLSAFAADGPMDLTPPSDMAGGKDGGIDTDALDDLISDLGDSKKSAPTESAPVVDETPLDDIDMHGLLDEIDVPRAPAPQAEAEDEMLDLSLDDLVEDMPTVEPVPQAAPTAASDMDMDLLAELTGSAPAPAAAPIPTAPDTTQDVDSLTLPDFSEPEHQAPETDTLATPTLEPETLEPKTTEPAELELSLPDMTEPEPSLAPAQVVEAQPDAAAGAFPTDMTNELADTLAADLADNLAMDMTAGIETDLASDADHHDLSGDMNLSLPDAHEPEGHTASGLDAESILEASDIGGGMLDGFDGPMPEIGGDLAMDANDLLNKIDDEPVAETQPEPLELTEAMAAEPVAPETAVVEAPIVALAAGAAVLGAAALAVGADEPKVETASNMTPELQQLLEEHQKSLAEFQAKLAELKTQVTGGSVNVVSIQGQLAEKDQVITELNERLRVSEGEAVALRQELADLRSALEDGLRTKSEEDEKVATQLKERLALLEDRQDQAARDMHTEIERAVPREAAKVIREEIAALAESMRD